MDAIDYFVIGISALLAIGGLYFAGKSVGLYRHIVKRDAYRRRHSRAFTDWRKRARKNQDPQ